MPDTDPRLEGAAQAFTRLTTIAAACADEGSKRWTAALDRQATLLDALNERGVTVAKTPPPSGKEPANAGNQA